MTLFIGFTQKKVTNIGILFMTTLKTTYKKMKTLYNKYEAKYAEASARANSLRKRKQYVASEIALAQMRAYNEIALDLRKELIHKEINIQNPHFQE